MKAADRIAEVLKTLTVASRRRGDQFTAQGGNLAVFGLTMVAWHSIAREVDSRRWRCDAIVRASRKPDRKSLRCSTFRRWLASGITTELMARRRRRTSRASARRPI